MAGLMVDAIAGSAAYGAVTGLDGRYVIPGLPTDSYAVDFRSGVGGPNYRTIYYNRKASSDTADLVGVTDGVTTSGIDAQVQAGDPYAQISGTVRDAAGAPVQNVDVEAKVLPDDVGVAGSAVTDAAGRYTIPDLPAGRYDLVFSSPPRAAVTWAQQHDSGVVATSGAVTSGTDVTLQPGAAIAGTVTDPQGRGVAGAAVRAALGGWRQTATTDATGRYTITGLAAGSYTVDFTPADPAGDLVAGYYRQRSLGAPPDPVAVTTGEVTTGIDAQLEAGGRITGTVTNPDGAPAVGASVLLHDLSRGYDVGLVGSVAADGSYTITNLEPGSYRVHFEAPTGSKIDDQYYSGQPSAASANPVSVGAGATTSGIDAHLQSAGAITGTVTDTLGRPVQGIGVFAFPVDTPIPEVPSFSGLPLLRGVITTDAGGHYRMDSFGAGVTRVYFSSPDYVPRYYGGSGTYATATLLTITSGATTSGVDAQVQLAGAITGRLTDQHGGRADGFVRALHPDGSVAGFTLSDGGVYRIANLAPGPYTVEFELSAGPLSLGLPTDPVVSFYDGRTSAGTADPVMVVAGATTSGIDGHAGAASAPPGPPAAGSASTAVLSGFHGTLAVAANGIVRVPLRCVGPTGCLGTASLSASIRAGVGSSGARAARARLLTIGRAPFRLPSGRASSARLPLSPAGRALLRRGRGRVSAVLVVTTTGAGRPVSVTAVAHLRSK